MKFPTRLPNPFLSIAVSILFLAPICAPPQPSANDILKSAQAQAGSQHKLVFLILGSSWCGPCHRLDRMLAAPEVHPILEKYFVIAKVSVLEEKGNHPDLNTPGGNDLWKKLANNHGVPYFVFEDADGKILVTSDRPVANQPHGANVGYPDYPEEIDWFISMLKTAIPSISSEESHAIDAWLRKNSTKSSR
jgi:hypothetical protein